MNLLTSGFLFGAGRHGFMGFDWTYLLAILGFVLTLAAQGMVSSTFRNYSVRVRKAPSVSCRHSGSATSASRACQGS